MFQSDSIMIIEKKHFNEKIAIKLGGNNHILRYISILFIMAPALFIVESISYFTNNMMGTLTRQIVWIIVNNLWILLS